VQVQKDDPNLAQEQPTPSSSSNVDNTNDHSTTKQFYTAKANLCMKRLNQTENKHTKQLPCRSPIVGSRKAANTISQISEVGIPHGHAIMVSVAFSGRRAKCGWLREVGAAFRHGTDWQDNKCHPNGSNTWCKEG
jgi:hypothetical protein